MMLIVYRKQIIACFLLVSITFESLVFVQYLAGALALILFSENPPTSRRKFGLQGEAPHLDQSMLSTDDCNTTETLASKMYCKENLLFTVRRFYLQN